MEYRNLSREEVALYITEPKKTAIFGHVNPDGDCVGSALALKALVEHGGGEAVCFVPGGLPAHLAFLPGSETVQDANAFTGDFDRIVTVDAASPAQLGDVFAAIKDRIDFTVDHHEACTRYADGLVDGGAAAAGEIVYDIGKAIEMRLRRALPSAYFACVYAAIASDTGGFRFSNTTPETHARAADLLSRGIDHAEINRRLFDAKSPSELAVLRLSYEKLELRQDGRLSLILATNEQITALGADRDALGCMIDVARSVGTALVALSMRQDEADPTVYKISARANADLDVASICASVGGGGHRRAAGCRIKAPSPEAAKDAAEALFAPLLSPKTV